MAGGQALDGQRTPAFKMDPWDTKVPGLDKVGRNHGPPELIKAHAGRLDIGPRGWKPGFLESVIVDGVWETVVVWKDADGTVWVVDGVQRVLAARLAAEERKRRGDDRAMLVPTLSPAGKVDEVHRFALSFKLNHLRHDDPPLVEAAKLAELFRMARESFVNGRQRTEAEALKLTADAAGKTTDQVRDALKLDAAPSEQKTMVVTGKAAPSAIVALQDAPVADQRKILAEVERTGPATTARVKEAVRVHKAKASGADRADVKVRPSTATMRRVLEALDAEGEATIQIDPQAKAMLRWVLGEVGPRAVTGLSPIVRMIEGGSDAE